jgi:oligopeptide/dipeptide ABC transporter ATP-binding protein
MIAMALAGDPALLLADEPTTALDVTTQAQILALVGALIRDRGTAVLLISHDLKLVARLCSRIYVLYAGRIVEEGPSEQVLEDPRHPYTRGLLGSRLSMKDRRAHLRPIPGEIPKATAWPEGCRFLPRCPQSVGRCEEEPPLLSLNPAADGSFREATTGALRGIRCWLADSGEGGD